MLTRSIGAYELEGLIGEGGIGQVYAAQDKVLGRRVAIKMLRPEFGRDRNFIERFYTEAKSLGNLNHTNITTLYALHTEGDDAFMVMELVHGQTLEALLARVGRLTVRDALAVLAQAIPGLRYAHRRGVIHRDIKPANLMMTDEGVVKIMDFGIARVNGSQHLTRVGEFCGTFVYASPEQIRGEEVDERGDLYSLAIVFYRLIAGNPPFASTNEYALMTAQLQEPPPPLGARVAGLEPASEAALMRALAKRPEDRFASVEEFGRAVGAMALRGEAVDIVQQLYARAFEGGDPEATRIIAAHPPQPLERTMPPDRDAPPPPASESRFRLPEVLPGASAVAGAPGREAESPKPALPRAPRKRLSAGVIGAAILAIPLAFGGVYLGVSGRTSPQREAAVAPEPATPEAPAAITSPVPVEATKPDAATAAPAPPPVATERTEPPPLKVPQAIPPVPVEAVEAEPPPAVETAPATPLPAPVETATAAPSPAPTEPAKAEPPPIPVEIAKAEPPPPVETAKPEPPPAPVAAEKAAPLPAPALTANPAPAPAPIEAASGGDQPATPDQLAALPRQAAPPQIPPVGPAAPAGPPMPEGRPDLEGKVSGARGVSELEIGGRWIRIYGILDRARGIQQAQHAKALIGYLKPSHNHLVCYRKPGDTYRCYSDGQDIARAALLDRVAQLAPNAPAEYRSLQARDR
jgi:serine/threonine-protein kinase